MAQQQQLNLSPETLTALLQALSALNLTPNGDSTSSGSTAAPTAATPAPSTAPPVSEGGNDVPAPSMPRGTPAPAVVSAVTATRPSSPVVARHPFTRAPLSQLAASSSSSSTAVSCSSAAAGPSSRPPPAQVHSGFHCSHCGAFNPAVGQSGESWYVVTAGREVGVFSNWEQVQPFVSGVPHACHKKYRSRAEADAAFETALAEGKVRVL
ncbi:uncharacterized protein ARMOST_10364 [Armillaria ostoyae]|uniref:Ribonuclease H1 N-terminal domain-containing protein n=1 Tax=Armillaria ostoyae TaxID=47428 RepID=A0A284RE38_ARMOS|nr:uncharacterized protein ARMOST_10364 [Armillaria ostoyae]